MDFYIQTFITTLKSISRVSDLFQTPDKWQMQFLEFPEKKCRSDRGSIHNLHAVLNTILSPYISIEILGWIEK